MARELRAATVAGLGMYVPERVMTNHDLEQLVETTDDWIFTRTGIRERRIAAPDQATSDLCVPAAREALAGANLDPARLETLIVATCTGDTNAFPAAAVWVQEKIGARRAAAFDVAACCSGYAYALDLGAQFIETGRSDSVLVIGAETMSRTLDWTDRNTCVLFGDGAGATLLLPAKSDADGAILGGILGSDGAGAKLQSIPGGGSRLPLTPDLLAEGAQYMKMNGREVYRFAVEMMGEAAVQAVAKVGLTTADVSLFIPHQANIRIITAAAARLGLPMDKVFTNVERYGNTSAASVPIALYEAWKTGRIKPGDIVVTVGFGAGLTWGANVIRWGNL